MLLLGERNQPDINQNRNHMEGHEKLILKNREKDRGCNMDYNESDKHPGEFPTVGKDLFPLGEILYICYEILNETKQNTILL